MSIMCEDSSLWPNCDPTFHRWKFNYTNRVLKAAFPPPFSLSISGFSLPAGFESWLRRRVIQTAAAGYWHQILQAESNASGLIWVTSTRTESRWCMRWCSELMRHVLFAWPLCPWQGDYTDIMRPRVWSDPTYSFDNFAYSIQTLVQVPYVDNAESIVITVYECCFPLSGSCVRTISAHIDLRVSSLQVYSLDEWTRIAANAEAAIGVGLNPVPKAQASVKCF